MSDLKRRLHCKANIDTSATQSITEEIQLSHASTMHVHGDSLTLLDIHCVTQSQQSIQYCMANQRRFSQVGQNLDTACSLSVWMASTNNVLRSKTMPLVYVRSLSNRTVRICVYRGFTS